ncbi:MAG TPA: tetratricopeptide repeat protein [Thermoanaerobaculia bacterium]|nr:tetratricopeptide repeat protein [Thermoanaerobaculia bacterium]
MKGFSIALPIALLSCHALAAQMPQPVSPPPPASLSEPQSTAAYQFALAKLLSVEGSLPEALTAYQEAERLAPDSPYVRLEHGQLLARLAQYSRAPGVREEYLQRAAETLGKARQIAPENLDVLRAVGEVYLDLSSQDPAALATAQEALETVRRRDPDDPQAALTLGQIYMDQRQPEKAAEVLRDLVTRLPQQRMAYALLVEALLRADKPAEAEKVLGDILGFDPGSLEARLTLVELQSQRGDHRSAVDTLRGAPEPVREEARVRRQLAWELYRTGELEAALETADALLGVQGEAGPDRPFLSLVKGLVFTAEGRHREALDLLDPLRVSQPDNIPLALTVARVMQRDGRRADAAKLLFELAERLAKEGKAEDERDVRMELVQAHLDAKEWDQAEKILAALGQGQAPADEPLRNQTLLLRTEALVGAGRHAEALAALDQGGASPAIQSRRAEVLFRSGDEREGRRLLGSLSESGDPQSALAAAQAYQRLDRYQESIPVLERLAAKQKDSIAAGFLLGVAYERTEQRGKAVNEFRRVLELDPDFHAALNYLGYTYAESGENLEEALSLVGRAVALEPDNGSYVDSLGWTYYQLGRHEQARDILERAVRLEPADATLQEHLGDVYVALGQKERAREAYRRALELADDNAEQVQRKLERLQEDVPRPRP